MIRYLVHNCFGLEVEGLKIIFDIPEKGYFKELDEKKLEEFFKNSEINLFISHSHADHFRRDITELEKISKNLIIYAPKDVLDLIVCSERCKKNILNSEANFINKYFNIQSFDSNDEGLAFLIQAGKKTIYFGGDLACWDWDDLTPDEYKLYVDYFYEILEKLSNHKIDIAFTNWDNRVKKFSGGLDFFNKIKPDIFIPMHFFGDLSKLESLNIIDDKKVVHDINTVYNIKK